MSRGGKEKEGIRKIYGTILILAIVWSVFGSAALSAAENVSLDLRDNVVLSESGRYDESGSAADDNVNDENSAITNGTRCTTSIRLGGVPCDEQWHSTSFPDIYVGCYDGVVITRSGSYFKHAYVYDPTDHKWHTQGAHERDIYEETQDGIVITRSGSKFMHAYVYDPADHQWHTQEAKEGDYYEETRDGVVITRSGSKFMHAYVYDPADHQWHIQDACYGGEVYRIACDGVVVTTKHAYVYSAADHQWHSHSGNFQNCDEAPPYSTPVADFTSTDPSGDSPLCVQFIDNSFGKITSRYWNFGDGSGDFGESPIHKYLNPGYYTVSLTISGSGGSDTETKTNYIHVTDPCNDKEGCYAYGNGCEDRDYFWDGTDCAYTYSNRHTDYYDGWINYCRGDAVWKHRLFHDFYCDGGKCQDHTSWKDDQLVENCNDKDKWVNKGSSYSCCDGDKRCTCQDQEYWDYYCSGTSCTHRIKDTRTVKSDCEDCGSDGWYDTGKTQWVTIKDYDCKYDQKEQKEQEYRDYYCSGGSCTHKVTKTQWKDTGKTKTVNKPDGTDCGSDYYDDWVSYCKGDEVWKHRQFHDFYCDGGTCTEHTSWVDDQLVESCSDYDGWVDTSETRWIDDPGNECKEKEQKEQKYHDYTCSGGRCDFSVTDTRWVETGNTRERIKGINVKPESCTLEIREEKQFSAIATLTSEGTEDVTPRASWSSSNTSVLEHLGGGKFKAKSGGIAEAIANYCNKSDRSRVEVNVSKNEPPIASFTYSPQSPFVEQIIRFDASSSFDTDGMIKKYEWEFGDGANATGKVVTHSYSETGDYTVTLTVTDDEGARNSTTKTVTVSSEQTPTVPTDSIRTDKTEYHPGDLMNNTIHLKNPRETEEQVFFG